MSKIWRPQLKNPDTFRMELDSNMLFHVYEGLFSQMESLRTDIREHEEICGANPTICQVRYRDLVQQYGSVEEAVKQAGAVLYDCMNDLADLYTAVGQLAKYLYKIDYLRKATDQIGDDPDKTDWRPADKLRELQAEVNHREAAAKHDTQTMEKVKDTATERKSTDKPLLGLTEGLKKKTPATA